MSCFVCSAGHVSILARLYVRHVYPHVYCVACPRTEDEIATILHKDNVAAFVARYPSEVVDALPFAEGTVAKWHDSHGYQSFRGSDADLSLGQYAKLLECYDYQLSDHPEYRKTESERIVSRTTSYLLHQLAGYEKARYSI